MSDREIQGKNWHKEVKSPKDTVPYELRLDFYLKRAARKAGLQHLSKDFDVTVQSQVGRGLFMSLDDLKKMTKKEYQIRSGDTLFKTLLEYFKETTNPLQAQKEAYLTLAYVMKTQSSSNVDKFFVGGKVIIENGRLTVKDAKGHASYDQALMRPELSVRSLPAVLPMKKQEPILFETAQPEEPTGRVMLPDTDMKVRMDRKTGQYLREMKGKPEADQFRRISEKIVQIEKDYEALIPQMSDLPQETTKVKELLLATRSVVEEGSKLAKESYPAKRIEAFKDEVEEDIRKIEETVRDPEIHELARELLGKDPTPPVTEVSPVFSERFRHGDQEFTLGFASKVQTEVKLDPEKGDRYFYHWIVRTIEEQNVFEGNQGFNDAAVDGEFYGLLVDQVIGICRDLNPSVDLDEPSSFNGKKLIIPQRLELKTDSKLVTPAPDEKTNLQVEKGSISKLLRMGKTNSYFVLNVPTVGGLTSVFDVKKVALIEDFNRRSGIKIEAGKPFRLPTSLVEDLEYQGEVRFIELSIKDDSQRAAVIATLTREATRSDPLVSLFTESYFYKKSAPANHIVVPLALLKADWESYLLDEYKVHPAEFRSHSVYVTGEYDLFLKHARDVEGLKYEDRDQMIKDGRVQKVVEGGRKFRFKSGSATEKEKYLKPYADTVLGEIAEKFYTETGYMLMITSVFRTPAEQKNLAETNSAATTGVSTHSFANSFDISNGRFIAPDGKEVTWSGVTGEERKKLDTFRPTIEKILISMQRGGKAMALRELYAWHVMISDPAIGDGTGLTSKQRLLDSDRETPPLDLDLLQTQNLDLSRIPEFEQFSARLIQTIKDRNDSGRKMKISEVQTMIQDELISKLSDSGQKDAAFILQGRTFEMANMINILVSTQESGNLHGSYCIYDERPEIESEVVGFEEFADKYALFKEARTSKTNKLSLLDSDNEVVGDYNMYKFLTKSNVRSFIDPTILIAKIAQETNFTFVKNLTGEVSDYTGQTVFGYFQITSKQDKKTEKRAKEIFDQLTGIPGTRFDFKEFKVSHKKGKYFVNPRAEIALAIAMYEQNAEKIRVANGGTEHVDNELLTTLSYNHGTLYIEDILKYGVTVSKYQVPGGQKLSYVDAKGIVHAKVVTSKEESRIRTYLNSGNVTELKKYLKDSFNITFVSGRSVGVRISEVEKVGSLSRNGKGQLYTSQVLSKSVMLKYIDRNNYRDMDESALADSMIVLSAQKPVSQSHLDSITPQDRR